MVDSLILGLPDQTFSRLHPLCPFSPAAIVQSSLLCWVASLRQCSIDDGRRNAGAAACDDWLGGVDTL